jgi:RNA polymerase sigma factor (sigma-70 family)
VAAAAALDSSDLSRAPDDLSSDSDAALAARASRGDVRAFERLHARWAARVERFAVSRLGSREDAEDVAQEVFLALHRGLARYEGRSSFGTWLLGIAYHLTCRRLRQRARGSCAPLASVERSCPLAAPTEARFDAARALERCVAYLADEASPGQRFAVERCVGGALGAASATRPARPRPEAVRAQLMRVRRKLRERVPGLEEALR